MSVCRLSPSYLYFLSGVFASAAVNLLTSVAVGPTKVGLFVLLGTAGCWLVSSIGAASMAELLTIVRSDRDHLITPRLSLQEQEAVAAQCLAPRRRKIIAWAAVCAVSLAIGVGGLVAATVVSTNQELEVGPGEHALGNSSGDQTCRSSTTSK